MRVLVAGATGALGRPLVRTLVEKGHMVTGLTRYKTKQHLIESLGARSILADVLDETVLTRAVRSVSPTHVVHFLTAIPPEGGIRPKDLHATNVLRTTGTRNLLRAAQEAGVRRMIAESFAGVYGASDQDMVFTEDSPLSVPSRPLRDTILALRDLEDQLQEARMSGRIETVILRFGYLYGPEVPSTVALVERLRRHRMILPSVAAGIGPFIHAEDAAAAALAALEYDSPASVYNIVDDEPMALADYVDLAAEIFGAPRPWRIPLWLLRLVAPLPAALASARLCLSNARARRGLGWTPQYPTPLHGLLAIAQTLKEAA